MENIRIQHAKLSLQLEMDSFDVCKNVQWFIFCLVLFEQLSVEFCRTFLMNQFLSVSQKFQLGIDDRHCRTLANMFLKNLAIIKSPRCSKESRQKLLKLS